MTLSRLTVCSPIRDPERAQSCLLGDSPSQKLDAQRGAALPADGWGREWGRGTALPAKRGDISGHVLNRVLLHQPSSRVPPINPPGWSGAAARKTLAAMHSSASRDSRGLSAASWGHGSAKVAAKAQGMGLAVVSQSGKVAA